MSLADGNLPLLIPPNYVNQDLDIMRLPTMTLADLTATDEYEFGARILVVLKGLVFDVTGMKEAFSPRGLFEFYPNNDITYALAKGSVLQEDARVGGESGADRQRERKFGALVHCFQKSVRNNRKDRSSRSGIVLEL
ncbi:hypothetical protein R3P38DRAFT_2961905, partial [Favolaschia claudopus]